MDENGEPPPDPGGTGLGGGAQEKSPAVNNQNHVKQTVTPSRMGDSCKTVKKMRTFQEILAEENDKRNIVEIKLEKVMVDNGGVMEKAKSISPEDVSILIFDKIGFKPEDCFGVALSTTRYDTKEVKLKAGVDPTFYISMDAFYFKDHKVEVRLQSGSITRVTFKNVPFNIPDEELINLCECYGEPVNNFVQYEKPSKSTRGVHGSSRYVEMKMIPGKQFENYYWMEGPLESDRGSRVTVLHSGQVQQCSFCLRRADSCPGGGIGKICEKRDTPKGMISDYMKHLKLHHNYTSLKMKYQQEEFPLLAGPRKLGDGFGHMVENDDTEEVAEVQGVDNSPKDARIAQLESQLSDQNQLRQQLTEAKARLGISKTLVVPLDFFEYEEETDQVITINQTGFEKFIDERCTSRRDRENKKADLKNKLLEQVRQIERKKRGKSISSIASFAWSDSSAKVRARSVEGDGGGDQKHSRVSPSQPV